MARVIVITTGGFTTMEMDISEDYCKTEQGDYDLLYAVQVGLEKAFELEKEDK